MSKLSNRLEVHFAACAAAVAGASAINVAEASIVYSGPVSIAVPNNIDGVYLNVVTGATGTSGLGTPGWDINPYSATAGNFNLWGPTATTWFNVLGQYRVEEGTVIGPGGTYGRPGGGTNVGLQVNLNSTNNFFGFQFANEANANQIHYGWVQFEFGANAGIRSIIGYAYEDVAGASIAAGAIPTPGAAALLAMGAVGLGGRRRR